MIDELKPYPEMKHSGVSWLGYVPAHWDVKRAKTYLHEVDERSSSGDEELLSVSHKTGVTPRSQKSVTMFLAESNVGHKVVRPGDVVVNTMWAWMAALGVSRHHGIVSPSYAVYRRQGNAYADQYLDELLRLPIYRDQYKRESTGITDSRLRLYPEAFLRQAFLVPPREEQVAIVRFLSHADLGIRRYVAAKQKLIKILEEEKQAIVRRAVTRGLDPSVRLKTSNVEWLGDVPEHWQVSRVKAEFECFNRHRVPLSGTERGAMTIRQYDYYGASGVIDKVDDYLFDGELLLIAEDGANLVLRNLPLAIIARGKFWVNNHAHILKPRRGHIEYLAAVMESITYLPWITGAAQPKLTQDRLMGIAIAVAPPGEQERIVAAIESETAPLRAVIERTRREIGLLREYRSRLVTEVVTGKLDVRELAASLPEEASQAEPLDEIDDLPQDEVLAEIGELEAEEAV